jgi:glycerate-2-kinase
LIKNKAQLIENGSSIIYKKLRSDACNILESALLSVNPEQAVLNAFRLNDEILFFESGSVDLTNVDHIFVIGGGKAGGFMSKGIETLLGPRISSGIVNVLEGTQDKISLDLVELNEASHPIPSKSGVEGVKRMISITSTLSENDLVFVLISGGGSALLPLPVKGVSLSDLREITSELLMAGATINEVNSVRKHLSSIKGGHLARHCNPARIISLILSDVIGDPIDTIASGPTAPDSSTYRDAYNVLNRYDLFENAPKSIREIIFEGINGAIPDTPKSGDPVFNKVHNVIIGNNSIAVSSAYNKAIELGYNSMILSTYIEGEARIVGEFLTGIAKEILYQDRPLKKPAAVIMGGETTVPVRGAGVGGRNQELVLGASEELSENRFIGH